MGAQVGGVTNTESASAVVKTPGSVPRLDFVGRMWALTQIDAWLSNGTQRFFHILGEPGSGKTALSRRLVQLSEGLFDYEGKLPAMVPGFIDASHFCTA